MAYIVGISVAEYSSRRPSLRVPGSNEARSAISELVKSIAAVMGEGMRKGFGA